MTASIAHPMIIQGGMGVGVSSWRLARAVARRGQLGVVSGSVLDTLFVRRLQDGDAGGHLRRALAQLPITGAAEEILERYFLDGGRDEGASYRAVPMYRQVVGRAREQLTVAANFCEVWLAKEGHEGKVGINLLTKVQLPNLASLYGAMLASVDYVLMGAGIPREIPAVLDRFARHEPASIRFEVEGMPRGEEPLLTFEPSRHVDPDAPPLTRPRFLPIIASNSLATMMAKKSAGRIDGFVVEGPTAGGHNAPPRGKTVLDEDGEPVYGEKDAVDLDRIRELGLPFWLAGGTGAPEQLRRALDAGAAGVQVGTLFAYCDESGIERRHKHAVLSRSRAEPLEVTTDLRASPTGFPFKIVKLDGSLSSEEVYQARERECDLGYLRTAYRRPDGRIDYRCPAEPVETYVKKGGKAEDTVGRKCLCNALLADVGHPQERSDGYVEKPLLTSGDDLKQIDRFAAGRTSYTAGDVLDHLLGEAVPA